MFLLFTANYYKHVFTNGEKAKLDSLSLQRAQESRMLFKTFLKRDSLPRNAAFLL